MEEVQKLINRLTRLEDRRYRKQKIFEKNNTMKFVGIAIPGSIKLGQKHLKAREYFEIHSVHFFYLSSEQIKKYCKKSFDCLVLRRVFRNAIECLVYRPGAEWS